jgi:YD repeat-containing protein
MNLKRSTVLFLLALISFNSANTQDARFNPAPSIHSPNTANLGMYGEVPVSMFTGLPQIGVPIFSAELRNVSLPITLTYHASGMKIDQHPSWVGMGWSLMAGGSITRGQRGITDEKNYGIDTTYGGIDRGFYAKHWVINRSDWSSIGFLGASPYFDNSDNFRNDLQPDDFYFSYPGNSGRFFLNQEGSWCVQSEKPVKLVFDPADITDHPATSQSYSFAFSSEKAFKKFTLIDGFGYKYIFGGVEEAIEYSCTYYPFNSNFSATSWQLTKIISPDGLDEIALGYERGPSIPSLYYTAFQKHVRASDGSETCGSTITSWFNSIAYPERGSLISPVYLKYIKCVQNNIQINFITERSDEMSYLIPGQNHSQSAHNPYLRAFIGGYRDEHSGTDPVVPDINGNDLNSQTFLANMVPYFQRPGVSISALYWENFIWLKLSRIEITNLAGVVTNTVNFIYNNGSDERLQLSQLSFADNLSNAEKSYYFLYNTQTTNRYLFSCAGDHWGFNNTAVSLPTIYLSGNLPNIESYREPDLQSTQAGVLTEIIYPTGGNTKFEYQLNTCSKVVNYFDKTAVDSYVKAIGGLRVKKITNTDAVNGTSSKEYYYVSGYTAGADPATLPSSGVLLAKPNYSTIYNDGGFNYEAHYSFPTLPVTEFGTGGYIGYSEVVEKLSDNSYTIYKYSNHDNGFPDETFIMSVNGLFNDRLPVSSKYFERGKLLEQTAYTNLGQKISSIVNTYAPAANASSSFARSVSHGEELFCSIPPDGYKSWTTTFSYFHKSAFKIFYYHLNLASTSEKTYSKENVNQFVEIKKDFNYNSKNDLTEEKFTGSTGEIISKKYKYPADFPSDPVLTSMATNNIVSPIIETSVTKNDVPLTFEHLNYFSPYSGVYVPQSQQVQVEYGPLRTMLLCNVYDQRGNIIEMQKANDVKDVYLWGYNSRYPVAKVTGSDYATVSFYVNQTMLDNAYSYTDQDIRNALNNIRTNLPGAMVTTYTYSFLNGMTSETDPRGKTIYYEYDNFHRLNLIRDQDGNVIKTFKYQYKF